MTNQNEDGPRCIAWSTEEEIVLCKGWVHVSEYSAIGNARRENGFWNEVLLYPESKTKATGHRTLKWMDSEVPNFEAKKRDAKRYKSSGSSSFNPDYENASINLNVDDGDDEEDKVQEVERLIGREKTKGFKKKGAGASG
ncbi:hypothetical protein Tco_0637686 [Tanacetum coccineum]